MAKIKRIGSVSLFAKNVQRLTAFYQTYLDMNLVTNKKDVEQTFLSIDSDSCAADLHIVSNPHHVRLSFLVDSITSFKEIWDKISEVGIPIRGPYVQKEELSFNFHDVEGNLVEIAWEHGKEIDHSDQRKISYEEVDLFHSNS